MDKESVLRDISLADVKNMTNDELNVLCDELRSFIYEKVAKCGGHLSSNLGAIEATVGLCKVFDFTKDKIIFDVGHQCYAYKALTGRAKAFDTLRQEGGLSGFPKRTESPFDFYDTGHAGTSVSAAIGIAKARDLKKEKFDVIAFIGDGSFNNGLIYEALNSLKILNTRILIVLNDNGMSISPTVGGMHEILSSIRENADGKDEGIRLLESFNLKYLGVVDGNEIDEVTDAFQQAKELLHEKSVLLHIVTKKGKGYEFCEEYPGATHGVAAIGTKKEREYSEILGDELKKLAEKDDRIIAVTAAMTDALGLRDFFDAYPERALDVSICEENAAVLCASLATEGMKPYYAIYSTFLQRAYDEIIHDVCSQDLPVTFCIDRAGISGADGETHQGVFDLSYLSMIPNLTIVSPKDTEEFRLFLQWSAKYNHPLAIRYPRCGKVLFPSIEQDRFLFSRTEKIEQGTWEYLVRNKESKVTLLATGERCLIIAMKVVKSLEEQGLEPFVNIVNARFVKPLDYDLLEQLEGAVITIEDNVFIGGFGAMVEHVLLTQDENKEAAKRRKFKAFAYKDCFIPQGSVWTLQREYGVSCAEIEKYVKIFVQQ